MTEANVTIKPTDAILAKANEETVIVDSIGRAIRMKKPPVLAQYRLVEALGDAASNQHYMAMVMPLIYVVGVDDLAVYQPRTKLQVEALINLLDEPGITAVMKHIQEQYAESDPEQDKADLKK